MSETVENATSDNKLEPPDDIDNLKSDLQVETKPENNPYAYLDREEFSSERFKIEIKNLPKYYGVNELRKLVNDKLKLGSNKIKFPRKNSPYVFVCFRNEEDRENAIQIITGFKWKGNVLNSFKAKPAPDPLVKRRIEDENNRTNKKFKNDPSQTQEERLKYSTIPLWNIPYKEQLEMKQKDVKEILKKLGTSLGHENQALRSWLNSQRTEHNELPCELLDIRYAETADGYRNKCEFTIGIDEETNLPTVGFRVGSYTTGKTGVAPIDGLLHIPEKMKTAVKIFQDFVRNSALKVFNPESQSGNFRQLTARNATEQLMLIVGIHPQGLSDETLSQFKSDLIEFFTLGPGKNANVTSLYYEYVMKKTTNQDVSIPVHLLGDTHIQEQILGLNFRISPLAFFQINTTAAEILYKTAIELAQPTADTTIVDICCGTGTIGICFAKKCSQVLGIEMVLQAVLDAKSNAESNDLKNCEFFDGKAEDILTSVLYRAKHENIIAIVDPPRAGLNQRTVRQLRKNAKIDKLIYISCNPNLAMKNFVDLGRPESKTLDGDPFVPVRAVAVDLFPHTKHCELVIYFQRFKEVESPLKTNENH